MISDKRVLAVVPARGGSKGVRLKNLRPVMGVPMVGRVGQIVKQVAIIDRAVVSTDHDGIANAAEEFGLAAPFRRPLALSGDCVGDWDVLSHTLHEMERIDDVTYDIIVMLQPTSPMRLPADVENTIKMLISGGWDAVWTVSETDSKGHPLKQLVIDDSNRMELYDPAGSQIIARQQLKPVFHRNGVAYAVTRDCLLNQKTIYGARTGAYIVAGENISIDTEYDIKLVEWLMDNKATPDA